MHPLKAALFDKCVKKKLKVAAGLSKLEPVPEHYAAIYAFGEEYKGGGLISKERET